MLPSFARTFSNSNLRSSRPSPPIETQIDPERPVPTDPRPYTLPPIDHIDSRGPSRSASSSPSHQTRQRRPYSHSVSAVEPPSTIQSQLGRKRSHDVAISSSSQAEAPALHRVSSASPRDAPGMSTSSRLTTERSLQDLRLRESDAADSENVGDPMRSHPALVRVKEEDNEESSPRPRSNSQSSGSLLQTSSNVLSPQSSRQQPHGSQTSHASPFMRESSASGLHRKSPFASPVESSTGTSLPKKRRVTVSGAADAPSGLRATPFIPPPLRGLQSTASAEDIEQLRTALALKQQQKALISARRTGKSGGATPEPSSLSSSFVQTHNHHPSDPSGSQASLASLTSPISPWDSSDVHGHARSFTSASTVPHETTSRASSPSHSSPQSPHVHRRKIRQSIGDEPSSSTMAAALDLEMEVESDASQLTRRRTQSNVLPSGTARGISSSSSSAASRRPTASAGSRPTVRTGNSIAEMERSLEQRAQYHSSRAVSPSSLNRRRHEPYDAEPSYAGQGGRESSVGAGRSVGHGFRSPIMPSSSSSTEHGRTDTTPMSPHQQSRPHGTLSAVSVAPHSYYRSDDDPSRGSRSYEDSRQGSAFAPPALPGLQTLQSGFTFDNRGRGGTGNQGDAASSRFASVAPQTPASARFTSHSPVAEIPQPRFPPPTSLGGDSTPGPSRHQYQHHHYPQNTSRPHHSHQHQHPRVSQPFVLTENSPDFASTPVPGTSGRVSPTDIISRDRFVSIFEGMYDSMVDARRVRAWIDEQQSLRGESVAGQSEFPPPPISSISPSRNESFERLPPPGPSYIRAEDVQSIVDARVDAVREESKREIEALVRRVHHLEQRVESKLSTSPPLSSPTRLSASERDDEHQGSVTPNALAPPRLVSVAAAAELGSDDVAPSVKTTTPPRPVDTSGTEMDVDRVAPGDENNHHHHGGPS